MKKTVEQPILKTRIKSDEVKIPEIALGYFLAPFCAMLANMIFGAYLTRYYADVLGWTKFGAGAFAALLPIVSVIFVVLGNLSVGKWIDNTRTTAGKARPFLFAAIPLLTLAIITMFTSPNNGSLLQMIWIAVSYNLYYSIAYPCYYTAHSSMVSLSTRDTDKRGLLATMSNASMVAAAGVGASIVVPILLQSYMFSYNGTSLDVEASYAHWRVLSICFTLVTVLGIILEYYFTRERISEETMDLQRAAEVIPMKTHVDACTKDKYWWMVILYVLFFMMGQLVKNTSMSFYARWMFDSVLSAADPESASGAMMSTLGLIGGLPSAVGMVIAWPLANKLGKQRAIVIGLIFSVLGGAVAFMGVHNFKMVCAGVVLKAVGIIPSQYVMLAVISDVLDHLEAKNGFRSDGFTMSIYGSIMVGLLGLAVGIVSGLLGMTGYDATLVKQPVAAENVLIFVYLGMDILTFIVSIFLLWRMDVEKYAEEDQQKIRENQEKETTENAQ
ncbi:MAG: MFS transporter [Lachnospiraceae bacterium]|nr:MFS transporter [Lachnospiraceae bacterium]